MTTMQEVASEFKNRTGITLWQYQLDDADRMSKGHFGCFQDTGLGKTYTALAALLKHEMEWEQNQQDHDYEDVGNVIWVAPRLSLVMLKENILKVWPDVDIALIRSAKDVDLLDCDPAFTLVTSDLIRKSTIREALIRLRAQIVIVDEAHRFKSPNAARTRALYGVDLDGDGGVIQCVDHVWLLTGTPMPNGLPGELYAHLRALWPQTILSERTRVTLQKPVMDYWSFRVKYHHLSTMIINGRRIYVDRGARNVPELKERTKGCWERRYLEDYLDLEVPIIEETVLESDDLDNFNRRNDPAAHLAGVFIHKATNQKPEGILDHISQQQISTAMRLTGYLKVDPTVALVLGLLDDGAPQVLVGFWHRDVGEDIANGLRHELSTELIGHITGGTSTQYANMLIEQFQGGEDRVLVGQISAMGEAHNLQNCHHVVLAEQSWVPGQNKQFIARCHRQGQLSRVIVHSVIIKGSLDENVCRALTRKMSDETTILEANENGDTS